jgi:hypothetical protein
MTPGRCAARVQLFPLLDPVINSSFQSLTFGRPPSLSTIHIDCILPHDTFVNAAGDVEMSCMLIKPLILSGSI